MFALIIYAGVSLIALKGRIDARRQELDDIRRSVAALELSNAELEYEIGHYNDPDVIAGIARARLGLVLPGEIVFYDAGIGQFGSD